MTALLVKWVNLVGRHARTSFLLIFGVTLLLGWVAVTQFRINSELSHLIDQTSDWRVDFDRFGEEFPDLIKTAVIVVKGNSIGAVEEATQSVVARLEAMDTFFSHVAAPGSEPFFRDHALLYMDLDQFDDIVDRLAEAQPLISRVVDDAGLSTVFELVGDAVENETDAPLDTITKNLVATGRGVLQGEGGKVRWVDEFFTNSDTRYQLIFVKPKSTFDTTLPDAQLMAGLREMRAELSLPNGVEIFFTGEIPLQHEEIEAAISGITTAGWVALGLLLLVLIVGVRSGKIIAATFSMLGIGVLWTSAFAMLAVGEYNTLSIVFLVMFFGLGVDFALHFSLRFQEAVNTGDTSTVQALTLTTQSVGRAIALCSITTAVGFLGFWPTAYEGLADLGVISACGMVVACFLTFTYLPAFYGLVGQPRAHEMDLPTSEGVVHWLLARKGWVLGSVAVGGTVAAIAASQASFDYSVLAIKDAKSESMVALRTLQQEGLSTDYRLVVVSDEPVVKRTIEALTVVKEVVVPTDLVPEQQEEKLLGIEDLQFMYWQLLEDNEVQLSDEREDVAQAALDLAEGLRRKNQSEFAELLHVLEQFSARRDVDWRAWQEAFLSDLISEVHWLRRALLVEEVGFDDLPSSSRSRLIGETGLQLAVIKPAEKIVEVDALSRFINEVKELYPHVTGRPVVEWGVGRIVINAFQEALVYAFVGISLILLVTLRRLSMAMLILCPLVLAALCTFGLGVALNMPLNMANILVLPLIFGLGVDNGIHVVDRFMGEGDVDHLMHSSTPRAVLLSTMTTIGAFAALSISPHMGTASIGLLLTIAIGFLLVFTIFLLPVLLEITGLSKNQAQSVP